MATLRRYRVLTPGDVTRLLPCGDVPAHPVAPDDVWLGAAQARFGLVGVGAFDGDTPLGHVLAASGAALAPGLVWPDADPASAWVARLVVPEAAPRGLGRGLVQALAGRLDVRQIDAISGLAPTCIHPSAEVLRAWGFRPHGPAGTHQLHRLDLSSSVGWRRVREDAAKTLQGLSVRPPVVAPKGSTSRSA